MLDRVDEAKRKKELFLNETIAQRVGDIFQDISARIVKDHSFRHDSIEELFPDYFTADKQLGIFDEESLTMLSAVCFTYIKAEGIPRFFKVDAAELGASALREAAFIQTVESHNSVDTVDERIDMIDAGNEMLDFALEQLKPNTERFHRLALQRAFKPVHQDIVSGEVTMHTVREIGAALAELRLTAHQVSNKEVARGLLGEIETLQHFWANYTKKGQHVAIPATMRGGSGRSNPDQTHDIDIVRQKLDGSWIVLSPIEVKRRRITGAIKRRYTGSRIAHVSLNGTVTISGEHRREKTAQ